MSNYVFAMIQLDGLIAGIEANSEIPVSLAELKTLRVLLGGTWNGEPAPANDPSKAKP